MKSKSLLFFYFLLFLPLIWARIDGLPWLDYLVKPLMMPILMVFVGLNCKPATLKRWTLPALLFCWIGDVMMMFQSTELFFMLGLGSFLLGHIFYCLCFLQTNERRKLTTVREKPLLILPFIAFQVFFLYLLWPGLGELKIPVFLYATAINLMCICALNRSSRVLPSSFNSVFIGALLFLVSDAIIGFNKFAAAIAYAEVWIIVLYLLGQALIVVGLCQQKTQYVEGTK